MHKPIELVQMGEVLSMGTFIRIDPKTPRQGENTLNICILLNGREMHYTESKGAWVEVLDFDQTARHNYMTRAIIRSYLEIAFDSIQDELLDHSEISWDPDEDTDWYEARVAEVLRELLDRG